MKNDFFIKLAKKDEKMTLSKIATVLCFIVHTMMLVIVNSESIHLYIDGYGRVSILHLIIQCIFYYIF
ncbi:hypothetical protein [Leptotrichia buccalis]